MKSLAYGVLRYGVTFFLFVPVNGMTKSIYFKRNVNEHIFKFGTVFQGKLVYILSGGLLFVFTHCSKATLLAYRL